MVSSELLWWREKGLTLHGEASTLHHELHLMLFNCVITWEISGVLLGKRQALQSVPQMFQGNNQKMKFIWLLKPLWQLPFHFSNLLCCLLPLPPVLHEIFAWKQNWGFTFHPVSVKSTTPNQELWHLPVDLSTLSCNPSFPSLHCWYHTWLLWKTSSEEKWI